MAEVIPEIDLVKTGKNIKKAIRESGISTQQFADRMSVSKTALYKWFEGQNPPSLDNLVIIMAITGKKFEQLVDMKEIGK